MKGKQKVLDFFPVTTTKAVYIDGTNKTLYDELNIENIKLTRYSVRASEIGLVPNSNSEGKNNLSKLVENINKGLRVLIDDVYYLELNDLDLNSDLYLEGIENGQIHLINVNKSYLFNIKETCRNIELKNLKINNSDSRQTLLFTNKNNIQMKSVNIIGCEFEGNISLLRYYGDINTNPNEGKYRVDNFDFNNNTVKNTNSSFILFNDISFNSAIINNNIVENFDYLFACFAISNEGAYQGELQDNMKKINCHDNIIYFTDDWWGAENGSSSGSYLCFLLTENEVVNYYNNIVEGIKSSQVVAVYDCYLSSKEVNYYNNVWKNNICFNINKTNNTLMKAKGTNKGLGYRKYTNNKFIIEKSFAEKHGKDIELLNIEFISCTSKMKEWVIKDNYFDCYAINFMQGSAQIKNFIFENNVVKSEISSGQLINISLDNDDDFSDSEVLIRNNTFELDTNKNESVFRLIYFTDKTNNTKKYKLVECSNNTFRGNGFSYLIYSVYSDTLIVTNNNLYVDIFDDSKALGLIYMTEVNKLIVENTFLNSSKKGPVFLRNVIGGGSRINFTTDIYNLGSGFNLIELPKTFSKDINYNMNFDIIGLENSSSLKAKLKLYDAEGVKKIKFESDSKTVDTIIGDSSEKYTPLKLEGTNNNNFSLKLYNGADYLRFIMYIDDKEYVRFKTNLISI